MKLRSVILATLMVATAISVAPTQAAENLNIGIAYDIGGRGDRSFNDAAAVGLEKAQKKFTFTVEPVVTDGTSADRERRIRSLVTKNCNPIIAVGQGYAPTLQVLAIEFPNTQFAILNDASIDALNVTSLIFADTQGAFLAGYSAALVSKTLKVAMIATPAQADIYQNGFVAGVVAAKRKVVPSVRYTTGSASAVTKQVMSAGADVIFAARPGSVSDVFTSIVSRNSVAKKAKNYKEVGMISLEPDQYVSVTSASKKYLYATIVKRVDLAMYDVITMAISGKQYLDVLDPLVGIYGHKYGIASGGISMTTYLPALTAATSRINTAALSGAKIAS